MLKYTIPREVKMTVDEDKICTKYEISDSETESYDTTDSEESYEEEARRRDAEHHSRLDRVLGIIDSMVKHISDTDIEAELALLDEDEVNELLRSGLNTGPEVN